MTEITLGSSVCAFISIRLCIYVTFQNRFHAKIIAVALQLRKKMCAFAKIKKQYKISNMFIRKGDYI